MSTSDLFAFEAQEETLEFSADRSSTLARLDKFASRSGRHYAAQRNYDFGSTQRSNVSVLSPWIRHGVISEQGVLSAVLAKHSLQGAEKFIQEVFWRSYFKGWLEHRPTVWSDYCTQRDRLMNQSPSPELNAALNGRTGIECFDHWVRELVETGYLHNHARMWFASIWIFTLKLPWQLGADFFLKHLLDGDPASNTLSWRWVAGLHTKGKTYLARADNIAKYTGNRFDPAGQLSNTAHPLEDEREHLKIALTYNLAPITGDYILLLSDDNVRPDLSTQAKPKAVIGLSCAAQRSPSSTSGKVAQFANDALSNALREFEQSGRIETPATIEAAIVKLAQASKTTNVVMSAAPVGPVADTIAALIPALAKHGITLRQTHRPYDSLCWPHATKGFFAMKKQIPSILRQLNLAG